MKLEYDDLELLALFAAAFSIKSAEAEKALSAAVAIAELSDWQKNQLATFRSKSDLSASAAKGELLSRFQSSSWNYANDAERARTVLWNMASIGFGNKNAVETAQIFANHAKINKSVLFEFMDILQTKSALRAKRAWAKDTLAANEADEIAEQCGEDWDVLKRNIGDLIDLG